MTQAMIIHTTVFPDKTELPQSPHQANTNTSNCNPNPRHVRVSSPLSNPSNGRLIQAIAEQLLLCLFCRSLYIVRRTSIRLLSVNNSNSWAFSKTLH